MTQILIVTADVLRQKMAGPAIRAWEMAKELSKTNDVRLVSTSQSAVERTGIGFEVSTAATHEELEQHVAWCDVLVFQGLLLSSHQWVADADVKIVADLYDPMHLEQLEQTKGQPIRKRDTIVALTSEALDRQIRRADYMMCASPKQRLFWLGQLAANGRINPYTYDREGMFEGFLDVVPFGVDSVAPIQQAHAIKGVVPGIAEDDEVLIWGGGIYNWFDPLTLVRAMAMVHARRPQARLFFMGSGHPNPDVPQMAVAADALELASELGLLDSVVFFNEGWVPYDHRADFLLDADLGVSTHHLHVETEFSFRTRILDYLWAGLPMIATEGDGFAEVIRQRDLGIVVPAENTEALAEAILELLSNPQRRSEITARVERVAAEFAWPEVLKPLVRYCANPQLAADRAAQLESDTRRLTHQEREIRALNLHIDSIERSLAWRTMLPARKVLAAVRVRLGRNPTVQQTAEYLETLGDEAATVLGLIEFTRSQRTDRDASSS